MRGRHSKLQLLPWSASQSTSGKFGDKYGVFGGIGGGQPPTFPLSAVGAVLQHCEASVPSSDGLPSPWRDERLVETMPGRLTQFDLLLGGFARPLFAASPVELLGRVPERNVMTG